MNESKTLEKKLELIADDKDFIFCVSHMLKTKEDVEEVIYYIDNGEDVSYENIILLTLWLNKKRKK